MINFSLNWKLLLVGALIAAPLTAYPTYKITSWYWGAKLTSQAKRLEDEKNAAIHNERKICADNQAITERATDELQKMLTNTNDRLASITKRLRGAEGAGACVPVTRSAVVNPDTPGRDVPAVQGGVVAGELIDAGGRADRTAARLSACQSFIVDTWAKHQHKP